MAICATARDLEAHNKRCANMWAQVAGARAELGAKTGLYREALDAREAAERECALEFSRQRATVAGLATAKGEARAGLLLELERRDAAVAGAARALGEARGREGAAHAAMRKAHGRLEGLDAEYQVLNGELAYMAREAGP